MRRTMVTVLGFVSVAVLPWLAAQTPPQPLPPSVLGGATPASPLVPVAATAPAKSYPIQRYQNLALLPPETAQAVLGMRSAAEWLAKQHLSNGRFLVGVNPALRTPLEGDSEFRQALATWSVAQAANFTGDEKLNAIASQAILTVLAVVAEPQATKNQLSVQAALALAIQSLSNADTKLQHEGEKLVANIAQAMQKDGTFPLSESKTTEDELVYPGLALQAIAGRLRTQPDAARQAALVTGVLAYRAKFKANPHPTLAGTLVPAAAEAYLLSKDANMAAVAFELGDWLCSAQVGKADAKSHVWVGGFITDRGMEPTFTSAYAARGLASACQLIRQGVPDVARYQRYRAALVESLAFVRGLQYTIDNTSHFTPEFRVQYLIGGVRTAVTDGNLRADATALSQLAFQRYLESGAEQP
jgi:hypothetical protein